MRDHGVPSAGGSGSGGLYARAIRKLKGGRSSGPPLSALPTGSLVFVLAQQYGVYVERSTAAILVSTILSVVTLFALFALLGIG
jgi:hypothetical protein